MQESLVRTVANLHARHVEAIDVVRLPEVPRVTVALPFSDQPYRDAALNRTESDLHEIKFALEAMRRLTERIIASDEEQPLLAELVREDVRFHIAIMTAAKNDLMKKEILRLHLINRVVSGPSLNEQSMPKKADNDARRLAVLAKHDEIYAAIERSDAAAAETAMEFHIQEMIGHNLLMMTRAESGVIARELTPEELAYSS